MKVLYTAFKGNNNPSKLLLDRITANNKIYLTNSFKTSVTELQKELREKYYDLIISFGQASLGNDTIKIETTASGDIKYYTSYNYDNLKKNFEQNYKVIISNNAGKYLCNNIYYNGLKYINDNNLNTKMIFVHIPKRNKISNIENLSMLFNEDRF